MKYLCLIYNDESKLGTVPKEQMDTMMSEVLRLYRIDQEERPVPFLAEAGCCDRNGNSNRNSVAVPHPPRGIRSQLAAIFVIPLG
jgi:hypothetical protein